jgi:hypothetical protein
MQRYAVNTTHSTTTFPRKDRDAHTNHEHKTATDRSAKEQRYLFLLQQKEQQKKLSDLKRQLKEQKQDQKNPENQKKNRDRELFIWTQAQAKAQGQAYLQEIVDEEEDQDQETGSGSETYQDRCGQHLDFGLPFA